MKTERLRRILSCALSLLLLSAALFGALPTSAAEEEWIIHYDFSGSTDAQRLANKAGGGTSALILTGAESSTREGVAYVSTKAGNYLSVPTGADVRNTGNASTLFLCFRAEGDSPNSVADIIQIGNVFRIAMDLNGKIFTRLGSGFATDSTTQRSAGTQLARNTWIRLALTLEISGTTVKENILLSTDEGKTWESTVYTVENVQGLYPAAGELLLGKVSKGIPDRGTSFSYRDIRLTDRVLTVEELQAIRLPDAPQDEKPDPKPVEPEPEPRADLDPYLVVHYDFLGNTDEERLRDKAPSGVSREDLLIYSSLDENGEKITKLNGDGTVTVDSKQANLLFALAGEDITGISESMTVFAAFQVTQKDYGAGFAYNPCAIAAIDNNLRFSFHNVRQIFTRVGENFTQAGPATGGNLPWGQWIYAAVSLKWDPVRATVEQRLFVSLDEGKTYTHFDATATGVTRLFSNATYLSFGKLTPGMADRGTNFRYKDIRIWNTALTETELKTLVIEENQAENPGQRPDMPTVNPDNPNPFDPKPAQTTAEPEPAGKPTESVTEPSGTGPRPATADGTESAPAKDAPTGCESAVGTVPGAVLLLGGLPFFIRKRRRDQ